MSRRREPPPRRLQSTSGTPIEEAPIWLLAIFTVILWLITFPAVVGFLSGLGLWRGNKLAAALAALGIVLVLVIGLATRKPWRRPTAADPRDHRPLFVRFSTWLIVTLLVPNVLIGVLELTHKGPPLTYEQALVIGALVSAIQGVAALVDRWKRRRAGASTTSPAD
jgi:membrane protease YdiL (CAAX protease family)